MTRSRACVGLSLVRECAGRLALLVLLPCASAIAAPTSIHGTVTSHFTGQPFANATVEIMDAQFHVMGAAAATDANGAYQWSGDCPDTGAVCNAVFFRTGNSIPHDSAFMAFANGAQDAVVDLQPHALAHLSGSVRGLGAGTTYVGPIVTFRYDAASSSWVRRPYDVQQTGFESAAQTIGALLPEGRYRVCLGGLAVGLQRQCFDHQPEAGKWSQQTYADIDLAEGQTRDHVDFDLVPGGNIAGSFIDGMKGVPLVGVPYNGHRIGQPQYVTLDLYDMDGVHFDSTYAYCDQQGSYRVPGTPAGTFRVQLGTFMGEFRDPLQIYPGVACSALTCPITSGTPVATADRGTVSQINITLHPNVAIHGTVTDALTHEPIAGATVAAWRTLPSAWEAPPQFEVYWTRSDAQGNYIAYAAADWSYGTFVAAGSSLLTSSSYPNAACPSGIEYLCGDPFPGQAVAVAVNAHTGDAVTGIDFALQQGGAFSGFVHDVTDTPVPALLAIYDASGTPVARFYDYGRDAFGAAAAYQSPALPPGTYYATASYGYGGPCQTYSARRCPPPQAQSILDVAPTPIVVAQGETRTGIDFHIAIDTVFADGFGG
jgi:hypothetical protein